MVFFDTRRASINVQMTDYAAAVADLDNWIKLTAPQEDPESYQIRGEHFYFYFLIIFAMKNCQYEIDKKRAIFSQCIIMST